ncbi:hypothetical protein VTO42DRAFT_1240 [Malbranchea cinnamomea]
MQYATILRLTRSSFSVSQNLNSRRLRLKVLVVIILMIVICASKLSFAPSSTPRPGQECQGIKLQHHRSRPASSKNKQLDDDQLHNFSAKICVQISWKLSLFLQPLNATTVLFTSLRCDSLLISNGDRSIEKFRIGV